MRTTYKLALLTEIPDLTEIRLLCLDCRDGRDITARIDVPIEMDFSTVLREIHSTLGCLEVDTMPSLACQFNVTSGTKKSKTFGLGSDKEWDNLVSDCKKQYVEMKRPAQIEIDILVDPSVGTSIFAQ